MVSASDGAAGIGGARTAGSSGETIEVTGRTVEDAVARALRELGCTRDDVRVDVLHQGTPGRLLGFGAEPARVRVTVVAGVATPPAERQPAGASTALEDAGALPDDTGDDVALEETVAATGAERGTEPAIDAGDAAETARQMLVELLARMDLPGLDVEVVTADPLLLNIRGGDVADLIGRRGENLRALQFVLSLMLNKQLRRHVRVTVDVDGYRARREELLRNMATRLAQRVRATGQPMPLEAMPPNERRIIHMSLAEDPEVMSESVGEGDARRVVLKPRR